VGLSGLDQVCRHLQRRRTLEPAAREAVVHADHFTGLDNRHAGTQGRHYRVNVAFPANQDHGTAATIGLDRPLDYLDWGKVAAHRVDGNGCPGRRAVRRFHALSDPS
jgi:hypothetical protein